MKKAYIILLLFLIVSCEKEPIYPTDELPANTPSLDAFTGISMWGEFIIIDAVMYLDNHETGQKLVYNHFGPNKNISSLRLGPPIREIETIIKNQTSFSFYRPIGSSRYGDFVLNLDTTKNYEIIYMGPHTTIIEPRVNSQGLLHGSGVPFSGQTISIADSTVSIQLMEVQGSLNGYNIRYWTQLRLKKIRSW